MYQGQVVIEGNLVRDPEKVFVGENGSIMVRFSIEVNRYFKNAQAEPVEEVMFITIQAWGSLAKRPWSKGCRPARQERWQQQEQAGVVA